MDEIRLIRLQVMSDPECGVLALSRLQRQGARLMRDLAARRREQSRIVRFEAAIAREKAQLAAGRKRLERAFSEDAQIEGPFPASE